MSSPSDKPPAESVSDSCFWPRPVDPDEAKRKAPAIEVDRSVVELTSPIGHRLRVPPTAAGVAAAPGAESVLSAAAAVPPVVLGVPPVVLGETLPPPKKKRR